MKKLKETYEKYMDFLGKRLDNNTEDRENYLAKSHREQWINIMRECGLFKV